MGDAGQILLVAAALAVTIILQVLASRSRRSALGLILPALLLAGTTCLLAAELYRIREGTLLMTTLTAILHYALYNILTILFLCIYNYSKRR